MTEKQKGVGRRIDWGWIYGSYVAERFSALNDGLIIEYHP